MMRNNKLNIAESTRWIEQMKRSIMHCHIIMAGDNLLVICFHPEGEKHANKSETRTKDKQLVTMTLQNTACGTL